MFINHASIDLFHPRVRLLVELRSLYLAQISILHYNSIVSLEMSWQVLRNDGVIIHSFASYHLAQHPVLLQCGSTGYRRMRTAPRHACLPTRTSQTVHCQFFLFISFILTYSRHWDNRMELALQVVGLKMTGKLEDAKSVAMRIVGPSNDDAPSGSNAPNETQLAADSISLGLRSALHHMGPWNGLEQMVIDLLSLLNVQIDTPSGASLARAMDHKTNGGQTLLHFAAFLKYPTLVSFLIEHEVDKDARDYNGHTALHLASLVGAQDCVAVLLVAGADEEIVNVEGKTPQELADFSFADLPLEDLVTDGESQWGDGEESGDEIVRNVTPSRQAPRIPHHNIDVAPSPPPEDSDHLSEQGKEKENSSVDEKRAPTFMRKIQSTLARVQPKDGIIPNMQLALPQLLHLPGMPGVPWGALPAVFPVYVPWTMSLRTPTKGKMRSLLTPQEWRTFLEKSWLMQGTAAPMQMHDGESPPVYTPRAEGDGEPPVAGPSIPTPERPTARQVGYDTGPAPDYREVNSYEYRPTKKQKQIQKKGLLFLEGH